MNFDNNDTDWMNEYEMDEYDREVSRLFMDEISSHDYIAFVNPKRYMEAVKAISTIKQVFDRASERYLPEEDSDEEQQSYIPVYDVGFLNIRGYPYGAMHLSVTVPEAGISLNEEDVEQIRRVLPKGCYVSIDPMNFKTHISFNFKDVRETFECEG